MAGIVHELEQKGLHEQVRREAANAAAQLAEAAQLHKGQIVVIGCSTSEVVGKKVGSIPWRWRGSGPMPVWTSAAR